MRRRSCAPLPHGVLAPALRAVVASRVVLGTWGVCWAASSVGGWASASLISCEGGPLMDLNELLERYEALGEERDFLAAKPLYEQAVAEAENPRLLNSYGYLLECHA